MQKRQVGRFTVYETAGSGQHRPCSFVIRRTDNNAWMAGNTSFYASTYAAMQAGSKRAVELERHAQAADFISTNRLPEETVRR